MRENKKLPIGIQTFKKIGQDNYCYVDKTHFVRQLVNGGTYYFLSRPRGLGKSLFLSTLKAAFEGRRRVVVVMLVDEYDKPILDSIENTKIAIVLRDELKNFYSVIKDADPYIEFVFITGVSKFSKVSLFSGLNNLEDITISPDFSAICGYTQDELENVFSGWIDDDVDLAEVKNWYNGYNWMGQEVYNPFDILL